MKTIMILEDDENLNRGISYRLGKEGYGILSAFSITDAKALQNNRIDLVISDITLPDGNGMDFCSQLRRQSGVYLIFLTALDQEIDIVNGYDSGADDYITKPFSLSILVSKVNALMSRLEEKEGHSAGGVLYSGDLILETDSMQVILNREKIPLSKKEYQILKLLLEHAGQIVTKEQILEAVWDLDGMFVDDNTVAVNISRLKNKLGTKALKNVRGVGYLWTEAVTTGRRRGN